MLGIPKTVVDAIIAHARRVAPEEACGILAGVGDGVRRIYETENALHSPVEYLVNPREQLHVTSAIFDAGMDDIAYYHSHPASRAYPSRTDIARVVLGRARLVIVSLENPDQPVVRSFFVEDGVVEEEEVSLVPDSVTE